MRDRLKELSAAGVSIWLDDLSRERLDSGNLAQLRDERSVVGVTTNPTIFAAALAKGEAYDEQIRELAASGASVHDAIRALTTDDVRNACDVFAETFTASSGVNGRVSIEVSPGLAKDTDGTITEAADLWRTVGRPNAMIKIPATESGLTAITATLADGISVNVTLIFALDRYARVINAYMDGLEQAAANGHDLSRIQSVASFFVSRVDAEVDQRLEAIGTDDASAVKGKAAVANARLAYALYQRAFTGPGWEALAAQGANKQRPLWASTGVKDPDLADTMYVSELVVADTVNTMPEKTMDAFADHGEVLGDRVAGTEAEARQVLEAMAGLGISYDDVVEKLEIEGVDKFEKSWHELVETVEAALSGDDKEEARHQAGRSGPDSSPAGVSVSTDPAAFVTG